MPEMELDVFGMFTRAFDRTKEEGRLDKPDLVGEHLPEIHKLAVQAMNVLKDGFQWMDIVALGAMVPAVMQIAGKISDLENVQKTRFVKDAMWVAYRAIDEGPSGKGNLINIPLLFGGLEKRFEEMLVKFAVELAIKAVYPLTKDDSVGEKAVPEPEPEPEPTNTTDAPEREPEL